MCITCTVCDTGLCSEDLRYSRVLQYALLALCVIQDYVLKIFPHLNFESACCYEPGVTRKI